ncbi:MAG: protein kinase [Deltaproteobacteria bacterium]|nr:protein kinase [Deltaproteobacteria bacterium]
MTTRVDSVGKYKLLRLIGEGGMGSVHLAIDTVLERQVAVKILHSHLCRSPEMRERFRNEAKTHGKLEHPNIVRVYDFVITEELLLIAMEFVPGGRNLGDLVHGRPVPQRTACDVLRQILRGVAFAHAEGVVHRDVKPANILVAEERGHIRPWLTDFGIAKALHTTSMTQPGSVLGTVDYMSPEQCLGKSVDQRSDLYSIGVVFYECLTGRVPFQAATEYQVMQAHVDNPPERPDRYNAELLPGLVAICLRALEKDPERRYQTANSILDDLDALNEDLDRLPAEPINLPPPRVTVESADDVRSGPVTGFPLQNADTAYAGVASQASDPAAVAVSGPRSLAASGSGPRPVTRSLDGPVSTAATDDAALPAGKRRSLVAWLLLVVLVLGGGAAATLVWLRLRETPVGEAAAPPRPVSGAPAPAADDVRPLLEGGRFTEALDVVLPRLAASVAHPDPADAERLADVLEEAATLLPPDRRAQAAQALERGLVEGAAGSEPAPEWIAAAMRGAKALAAAGDVTNATRIVSAATAHALDPQGAADVFEALARGVPVAASLDDAFSVVRLLSGIAPDSALYDPARRALGTAKEALLVREGDAAEEALRAGRWNDATSSLTRLREDLGDTRESTRQLELKARDLGQTVSAGPCTPAGLAMLRDPDAPSRAVGRPQVAWTGEEYLVAWSDGRAAPEDSNAQQIYLQRLDASGKRLLARDLAVSARDADAARPTIDCLDKQCGLAWDEIVANERRVVFRSLDFLGNPAAEPAVLAVGVSPAAYPTVAASRSAAGVVFAVAWAGRETTGAAARDSAAIAFLDREGKLLDGPRFVRLPRPEEPGARASRARASLTRLPHVVGLGDAGFAVAWEEEGEGLTTIALAAFAPTGGEPLWVERVLAGERPARSIQGRIPILAWQSERNRIAVVWVDRAPDNPDLDVSFFDPSGAALGTSLAARGSYRYHSALFVGDDLVTVRWSRAAARLDLTVCPLESGCPESPSDEDPAVGVPLAGLGGRVGLAPGAAKGEFAAVWRERPGAALADTGSDAEDAPSVGNELFFVRFRCGS